MAERIDRTVLLSRACVSEGDGDILRLLLDICSTSGGNTVFKGTAVRACPKDRWESELGGLGFPEPARPFTLSILGMEGLPGSLPLFWGGDQVLSMKAGRLLGRALERKEDLEAFLERNESLGYFHRFAVSFGGIPLKDVPCDGTWLLEPRPPKKRGPKRIIW